MQKKRPGLFSRLKRKLRRLGKTLKAIHIPVMNVILVVLGVGIFLFTRRMIELFEIYGAVPDTLIISFFGMCGTEAGIMGWIQKRKERRQEREWELEDRKANEKEMAEIKDHSAAEDQPRNNL